MLRKWQNTLPDLVRNISVFIPRLAAVETLPKKEPKAANDKTKLRPKKQVENIKVIRPLPPVYFKRLIGSSNYRWQLHLSKYPGLKTLKSKDIENTVETLKRMNFSPDDIVLKPMILFYNSSTIENRCKVLQECGFAKITVSMLTKFVTVVNKTLAHLKSHGYIAVEQDVKARLESYLDDIHLTKIDDINENQTLKLVREKILNNYLRQRLNMSDDDIVKLWKSYVRVRHKSFETIVRNIKFLMDEINFSEERIVKNGFLLHGDVDNMKRILDEIKTINGQDIRTLLYKRPKLLMSSCDSLLKSLQHVKSFGISEEAVVRCLEVLTLGPDTVFERLQDIADIEEFEVLGSNPRILRLVHYQNKARLRLEYLHQLRVKCASLHILSCGSEAFAKFAREGADRSKGRDIVVYLANEMGEDENEIRSLLSRHPNWCHVPALQVKHCYDFLRKKQFTNSDIFRNIHILLYPISRIEDKLQQIAQNDFFSDLQIDARFYELEPNVLMTLILYFIENEFHFTGDGIWPEQQTFQVENFNSLLPDFPESLRKDYRYGIKPVEHRTTNPNPLL